MVVLKLLKLRQNLNRQAGFCPACFMNNNLILLGEKHNIELRCEDHAPSHPSHPSHCLGYSAIKVTENKERSDEAVQKQAQPG